MSRQRSGITILALKKLLEIKGYGAARTTNCKIQISYGELTA